MSPGFHFLRQTSDLFPSILQEIYLPSQKLLLHNRSLIDGNPRQSFFVFFVSVDNRSPILFLFHQCRKKREWRKRVMSVWETCTNILQLFCFGLKLKFVTSLSFAALSFDATPQLNQLRILHQLQVRELLFLPIHVKLFGVTLHGLTYYRVVLYVYTSHDSVSNGCGGQELSLVRTIDYAATFSTCIMNSSPILAVSTATVSA
ncbi:hypothetical protein O6P43_032473 [Quillaja saponaria]|uniref:Uncharacterized protein n=1 Tax=Quillaja saponaria TaxID=32244 RepID=A0AAD7KPJ9_QUISA|nr:hypothetical protein O6P43_032473 [Quillaja saponaria]